MSVVYSGGMTWTSGWTLNPNFDQFAKIVLKFLRPSCGIRKLSPVVGITANSVGFGEGEGVGLLEMLVGEGEPVGLALGNGVSRDVGSCVGVDRGNAGSRYFW